MLHLPFHRPLIIFVIQVASFVILAAAILAYFIIRFPTHRFPPRPRRSIKRLVSKRVLKGFDKRQP